MDDQCLVSGGGAYYYTLQCIHRKKSIKEVDDINAVFFP